MAGVRGQYVGDRKPYEGVGHIIRRVRRKIIILKI